MKSASLRVEPTEEQVRAAAAAAEPILFRNLGGRVGPGTQARREDARRAAHAALSTLTDELAALRRERDEARALLRGMARRSSAFRRVYLQAARLADGMRRQCSAVPLQNPDGTWK